MPRIYLSLFLLLSIFTKGIAQVHITIKSATDKVALPYATIVNLSSGAIYSADKNGELIIPSAANDSIRITYIGYKETVVTLNDKDNTIYLEPAIATLKAIVLQPCKLTKITKIKSNKGDGNGWSGIACGNFDKSNGKVAFHISSGKSWAKLMSLNFWLRKNYRSTPDYAIKSPLAVSFYTLDEATKLPGELLNDKPIFIFPEKEGKQKLELDSLDISLPKEGIFISFEFILDTTYQWKTISSIDETITVLQGVVLVGALSEGFGIIYFDFKKNAWFRFNNKDFFDPTKKYGSLKLETTFKICKD
jgi:hypothetical protein